MPRKCANGSCRKLAILKRPKTEPDVLPEDKKLRRSYGQYTTDSLEKAIKAVKEDEMSYTKAAKEFSVPMSTLKDHVNGRCTLGVKPGRRRSIPMDVENSLVDKAIAAAQAGFPITKEQFMLHVELTAKKMNLTTQFRHGVPGDDYWRGLKTRRPDLIIRKSDNCNINLKKGLKEDSVSKYFNDLQRFVNELSLVQQPARIWNADEIGIQYCAEPIKIITKRGTQHISLHSGLAKEVSNAFLCVNAAGAAMPPLLLVKKGDTSKSIQKFSIENTPQRTVWTVQENSWDSEEFMVEWFKDIFLHQCGPERPQLLIMDSHGSHEMVELLEFAQRENIHILALPPRTSPWLEPLDRGIFMPFQKACRKISLQLLCENSSFVIDQQTWPGILCQVWDEVMQADLIKRSFEVTGAYPIDRSKIPRDVFSQTMRLDIPLPDDDIMKPETERVVVPHMSSTSLHQTTVVPHISSVHQGPVVPNMSSVHQGSVHQGPVVQNMSSVHQAQTSEHAQPQSRIYNIVVNGYNQQAPDAFTMMM